MNKQKYKSTVKQLFSEITLHGIAEVHACTGIVVLMYISIVVQMYCRMAMWIYFNRETEKHTGKSTMKRIYKSIVIHLLRDKKQTTYSSFREKVLSLQCILKYSKDEKSRFCI
jgi:hypothetical protein